MTILRKPEDMTNFRKYQEICLDTLIVKKIIVIVWKQDYMGVLANVGIQIKRIKSHQEIKPVKPPDMNKKGGEG